MKAPDPYGKIICIGRNYAKHAAEMSAAIPSEPLIFLKPSSALISSGESIVLPGRSKDVHHEVELVLLIGTAGKEINVDRAIEHVSGYAVGLDMTARDLQAEAKKKGHPWSVSKGFDTFSPLGDFVSAVHIPDPQALEISLSVNGEVRQHGTTADMLFSVTELISYCSQIFTLEPGDLIYTGTPEGVGPVFDGDELVARITGLPDLRVSVSRD